MSACQRPRKAACCRDQRFLWYAYAARFRVIHTRKTPCALRIYCIRKHWMAYFLYTETVTPKNTVYITLRTDSKPHRLTKSPLTQPLPACCTLSLQSNYLSFCTEQTRRGWVSGLFVRRWGLLSTVSILRVIYILWVTHMLGLHDGEIRFTSMNVVIKRS